MVIVLRDSGTLKFVKYVSANAKGDRWDIAASFDVEEPEDDGDGAPGPAGGDDDDDDDEEEFNGFSDRAESDSE